ncbi:hypothetical protein C8R47DRAFT_116862 [Mycena vitilis]|nr:hypothetical protein C8R47DRAFT_116862 [Mycena vitilis]
MLPRVNTSVAYPLGDEGRASQQDLPAETDTMLIDEDVGFQGFLRAARLAQGMLLDPLSITPGDSLSSEGEPERLSRFPGVEIEEVEEEITSEHFPTYFSERDGRLFHSHVESCSPRYQEDSGGPRCNKTLFGGWKEVASKYRERRRGSK